MHMLLRCFPSHDPLPSEALVLKFTRVSWVCDVELWNQYTASLWRDPLIAACFAVKFITWKASHHSIFIQHPKKWSPNRRTLRDDKRAAEAHLPFSRIAKGFSGWVALEHKEKYGGLEQLRDVDVMQCHANCFPAIGVHGLMTEPPGFALCFPFFWYSPRHLTRFLIFALALARQSIHRCEPQGGSAIAPWASASTSFRPRCNGSTGCGADACHCSTSNFRDSVKICQGLGSGCNPAISSL